MKSDVFSDNQLRQQLMSESVSTSCLLGSVGLQDQNDLLIQKEKVAML